MTNKESCSRYYHKNKEAAKQKVKEKRQFVFDIMVKIGGCFVCKNLNTNCLDWHHLRDKKFDIGTSYGGRSLVSILDEICKCVLLCRNCHILSHYKNSKKRKSQILINELKRERGCYNCGIKDFRVLAFHHKADKKFNISRKIYEKNIDKVLEEIEKCEILCGNCHRIEHSSN